MSCSSARRVTRTSKNVNKLWQRVKGIATSLRSSVGSPFRCRFIRALHHVTRAFLETECTPHTHISAAEIDAVLVQQQGTKEGRADVETKQRKRKLKNHRPRHAVSDLRSCAPDSQASFVFGESHSDQGGARPCTGMRRASGVG